MKQAYNPLTKQGFNFVFDESVFDYQNSVSASVDFTTSEPSSPTTNIRYLNTVTGTSSVTSQIVTEKYIYQWNGINWTGTAPLPGMVLPVELTSKILFYDGTNWVAIGNWMKFIDLSDTFNSYSAPGVFYKTNDACTGVEEFLQMYYSASILHIDCDTNISGSLTVVSITDLMVEDKTIVINVSGSASSGGGSGIFVEEDGVNTAYAKIADDRNSWQFKVPNNDKILTLDIDETSTMLVSGSFTLKNDFTFGTTYGGEIDFLAASKKLNIEDNLTIGLDINALEGLSGAGLVTRTAANTYTERTITGTANQITVTDGDGVSGNPTISLPAYIYSPAASGIGVSEDHRIQFNDGMTKIFSTAYGASVYVKSSGQNYLYFFNTTTGQVVASDGTIVGIDSAEKAVFWNRENTDMYFGVNNLLCATFAASDLSLTLVGNLNLANTKGINTPLSNDAYVLLQAYDNVSALAEVARIASGVTPAFEIKSGKLTGDLDGNSQDINNTGDILLNYGKWLQSVDNAGTGEINIVSINSDGNIIFGSNVVIDSFESPENSLVIGFNTPVTAASSGDVVGLLTAINSQVIFGSHGKTDGAGSITEPGFIANFPVYIKTQTSTPDVISGYQSIYPDTDKVLKYHTEDDDIFKVKMTDQYFGEFQCYSDETITVSILNTWYAISGFSEGNVNGWSQIDATDGIISSAADAGGGKVKFTTSAAHGLNDKDIVEIVGTTDYNGEFIIDYIDDDEFTVTVVWVSDQSGTFSRPDQFKCDSAAEGFYKISYGLSILGDADREEVNVAVFKGLSDITASTSILTVSDVYKFQIHQSCIVEMLESERLILKVKNIDAASDQTISAATIVCERL